MKHSFFFILLILLVSLRVAGQDRIDWDQIKAAPGANYLPKSNVSGDGVWTAIGAILSGANAVYGTGSTGYIAEWLNDSTLTFDATGAYQLSVGTDAQRPTGAAGLTRYNTTNGNLEYYGSAAWEYPVKSASSSGLTTSTYLLYGDANGRATGSSALTWTHAASPPVLQITGDVNIPNRGGAIEKFQGRFEGYGSVNTGGLQFSSNVTNGNTLLWIQSNGTGTTAGFDLQAATSTDRAYVYYVQGTGIQFGTVATATSTTSSPTVIRQRLGTGSGLVTPASYDMFKVNYNYVTAYTGLLIDPMDSTAFVTAYKTVPLTVKARMGQEVVSEFQDSTNTQIARLKGSGQWRWNKYGSGTFAGTPVYLLGVNSSKDVVEYAFSSPYTGWTLAGASGTPQSIGSGQTATFSGAGGLSTSAGATRTLTITADTSGTLASKAWASARSWTLAGDSGTGQAINWGNTASILGGYGINTVASATDVLTITADTLTELATQYDVAQGWLGPRLVAGTVNIDVLNATNSDLVIDTLNDIAIRGDGQFALKKLNGSGWFEIESENDSLNILADGVGIVSDSTIRMATKYLQANGVSLWRAAPGSAPYSEPAGTYLWTVDENGQNGAWADASSLGAIDGSGGADQVAYFSDANTLTSDASLTYDGSSAITIDDGSYSGEYSNYSITISDAGTAYDFYADPYQINNIWDDSGVSAMRKGSGYLSGSVGTNQLNGTSSSRYNQAGTDAPLIFGIVGASDDGNNSVGGELALRSSRTTSATAHGVTQSGDLLGRVTAWGNYDQTGATLAWSGKAFTASMAFKATETFSNTARGSKIVFSTTDNTTTTINDRLTIDHDGSLYSTGSAAHDVTFDDVDGFAVNTNDQWLNAGDGYGGIEGTYTNSPRTYKYGLANTLDGQGYSYL